MNKKVTLNEGTIEIGLHQAFLWIFYLQFLDFFKNEHNLQNTLKLSAKSIKL